MHYVCIYLNKKEILDKTKKYNYYANPVEKQHYLYYKIKPMNFILIRKPKTALNTNAALSTTQYRSDDSKL